MIVYLCDMKKTDTRELECHLTDSQLARYRRCLRPERQRQYLCSRVFYNRIKKSLHAAGDDDFPVHSRHRPLMCEKGLFYTSLSHSGDFFALSLSSTPAAVDMEVVRQRNFPALADCAFERPVALKIKNSDNPKKAFHERWAQRECQIKLPDDSQKAGKLLFTSYWEKINGSEICLGVLRQKSESVRIERVCNLTPQELSHEFK